MKKYLIVSYVPLPDVLPGQPTVVVASPRWDGLAADGKVSILTVSDQPPVLNINVATADDETGEITLEPNSDPDEWDVDFSDLMPLDATVREMLDWVRSAVSPSERRGRAYEALVAEQSDRRRTSLLDALQAIVEGDSDD